MKGGVTILSSLWSYRGFILAMVKRDFQSKYLNSVFGFLWSIFNPLAIILVYTFIFSQIMSTKLPNSNNSLSYSVYLCAGLLPWQFFSETIIRMQNIFIEQGSIMKKVKFPRSSLPIYILLSSSTNFIIIFALYLVFLAINGLLPGLVLFAIFPLLAIQQLFALSIGIITSSLNVFIRDIGQAVGIIMQFWVWFTPIVYSTGIIPVKYHAIFKWNPMVSVIQGYQSIFLYHLWPDWSSLFPIVIATCFLLFLGYITFKKLEKEMVDEL